MNHADKTPDANAPAAKSGPVYSLDQFGPVEKPADAEATFQKASKDIIASGGGILMIPSSAAAGWKPKNTTQEQWRKPEPPEPTKQWGSKPGVTVVEGKSKTLLGTGSQGHIVLKAAANAAPIEDVPISVLAHVSINFVVKVSYSSAPILLTIEK